MTLQSRVRALETQLSSTKQEKSQLLATLELERTKLLTLGESQHRQARLRYFHVGVNLCTLLSFCNDRESAKTEAFRTSYQQSTLTR